MSNIKMSGSGLTSCFEVEQLERCIFFDKHYCINCYSKHLWSLRKSASNGHSHKRTSKDGLIRLGTYIEILPRHYDAFKKGEGRWNCCGKRWLRPDFRTRKYYMMTRGLNDFVFYERVLADDKCLNMQVSVDVLPSGEIVPDMERLRWFLKSPKVIFRFKTSRSNVRSFVALQRMLEIPKYRIVETILKTKAITHYYGTKTFLEDYWNWKEFWRCNTKCENCKVENPIMMCSATEHVLPLLSVIQKTYPPRNHHTIRGIVWRSAILECMMENGGTMTIEQATSWFLSKYPVLKESSSNWQFKLRVAMQRQGKKLSAGTYTMRIPIKPITLYGENS